MNVLKPDIVQAIKEKNFPAIERRLDEGTSANGIDYEDNLRQPILHVAVKADNLRIIKTLLEKGADANGEDASGKAALHVVRTAEATKLLLSYGASVVKTCENGRVPLHYCQNEEIARVLILAGSPVNIQDKAGSNPLHYARSNGIAQRLLGECPSLGEKDGYGITPLHLASSHGNWRVVRAMMKAGISPLTNDRMDRTAREVVESILHSNTKNIVLNSLGVRNLLITSKLLQFWEEEYQGIDFRRVILSSSEVLAIDRKCSWSGLQTICRDPPSQLSASTRIPTHLMHHIVDEYLGPFDGPVFQTHSRPMANMNSALYPQYMFHSSKQLGVHCKEKFLFAIVLGIVWKIIIQSVLE